MELTTGLKNEYLTLWQNCQINPAYADGVAWYVKQIEKYRDTYESVAQETDVPWFVIAVIHAMESTFKFTRHLHNGDPLTSRTVNVPAGRPKGGQPPFTWKESAIDALEYDGATAIRSWDLPTVFWFLEGYNGWGYRTGLGRDTTPPCRSAYIYSGTNHYIKGKYVGDGVFDRNAVSDQVGCMAQLKELENKGLIRLSPSAIEDDPNNVGSVAAWQNILNGCGYFPVLTICGEMDEETVSMTKKFQKDLGLEETGKVDLVTWQAGLNHEKLPGWSNIAPIVVRHGGTIETRTVTQKLYDFYSKPSNYDKVYADVMNWYGTTANACVAFVTSALRLSGYPIPKEDHGYGNISLWTTALSHYLQDEKHWAKSTDTNALLPGDIIFTVGGQFGKDKDGVWVPNHVYMFAGWSDQANHIAWVIDNQEKYRHTRHTNAIPGGKSAFHYFLRA
jgi:lysozyme family protein